MREYEKREKPGMLRVIAGLLFCGLVVILFLILFQPNVPLETYSSNDFVVTDTRDTVDIIKAWNEDAEDIYPPPTQSTVSSVAKFLEDMGAGILALIAVLLVAIGLGCLICACCCCE